jgi:hypothetical protein
MEDREILHSWKNIRWIIGIVIAIVIPIILEFREEPMPLIYRIIIAFILSGFIYLSFYLLFRSYLTKQLRENINRRTEKQIEQQANTEATKLRKEIRKIIYEVKNKEIPKQVQVEEFKDVIQILSNLLSYYFPITFEDILRENKDEKEYIIKQIKSLQEHLKGFQNKYKDGTDLIELRNGFHDTNITNRLEAISEGVAKQKKKKYHSLILYELTLRYDSFVVRLLHIYEREKWSNPNLFFLSQIFYKEKFNLA